MKITVWAGGKVVTDLENFDLAQLLRCSQAEIYISSAEPGKVGVDITPALGRKCARSRKVLPEVGSDPEYPDLSLRDADAVRAWKAAHA